MKEHFDRLVGEVKRNPLLFALVLFVFILMTSFSLFPTYRGTHWDAAKAGEFGDFVGGYFGPILSLIGIVFVVLTIREQRETTLEERKSDAIETFENRYYQMLRIHRDNVTEMTVGRGEKTILGRKVFVSILSEVQHALRIVRTAISVMGLKVSSVDQLQIAYYAVFFGIGPTSSAAMREALRSAGCSFSDAQLDFIEGELKSGRGTVPYAFFDGHQSRLGHYYRHLYQAVSYVHDQQGDIVKSDYVKTIRAQLSTQEQALLLINSLTALGWKWWTSGFMVAYGMAKNIPKGLVEEFFSFAPEELFPNDYFEWQEPHIRPPVLDKLRMTQLK